LSITTTPLARPFAKRFGTALPVSTVAVLLPVVAPPVVVLPLEVPVDEVPEDDALLVEVEMGALGSDAVRELVVVVITVPPDTRGVGTTDVAASTEVPMRASTTEAAKQAGESILIEVSFCDRSQVRHQAVKQGARVP
jgi:hypothetical protein